jgi:molecular chaperone DnaK (HSP70)
LLDVTPLSLGIETLASRTKMIKKTTTIPTVFAQTFQPPKDVNASRDDQGVPG